MAAISWANPVNGDWSVGTNWSAGAIPSLSDSVTISASGSYTVTISSINVPGSIPGIDVANSLTFDAAQASLVETTGHLVMVGALAVKAGSVSLNTTNIMSSVALSGGEIAISNGGALGTGGVAISGGELLAAANLTLSNQLTFSGTSTIAAAHGTTLNEDASSYTIGRNTTLDIGASGQDGTILWSSSSTSSVVLPTTDNVDVQAGTLKAADGQFSTLLSAKTTVASGATIDVAGFSTTIADLLGAGSVTDSGAAATLTLSAANFSGVISGPLSLVANGAVILTSANTYTGTTTIQAGGSLQLGAGGATGSIAGGGISDAGTLTIDHSGAFTLTNAVSGAGALNQIGTGVTSINTANTFSGGATLAAGTLAIGNGGALGTGALTITKGELLGTASETLANNIILTTSGGTATFLAAPNTALTLTGALTLAGKNTIDIGASGQTGTIVWDSTPAGTSTGDKVVVLDGVLAAGNSELGAALSAYLETTVDAGATLDWAGNVGAVQDLTGPGTVTDSGAAQTMTLSGTTSFSGTISGALALVANGPITLTGANTYTGTTTIQAGDSLQLGVGGAAGSIAGGDINDAGALTIDHSGAFTLSNTISGAGVLNQIGTSVTSITAANTFSGGVTLSAGTLAIGNGGALGTGALTITKGELLGTASETLANDIILSVASSTATLAAAPTTSLTLTGALTLAGNNTIDVGASGQTGTIVWDSTPGGTLTGDKVVVVDGVLAAGNSELGAALSTLSGTTVDAGATLDWAGNVGAVQNLQGAGTVTNSGAAQTLTLSGTTNFSGTISGALSLVINGNATLSGLVDATGSATLNGATTLARVGVYDIAGGDNIVGTTATTFTNGGRFEKIGAGVSTVSSNFVNDGTLNVVSGSIEFTGGFTNRGVIDGVVTQSGGVTTITAPAPSDFNGDGLSDILWQNTDGQAQIWEMNGTTPIAGGSEAIAANPGPTWSEVGTGDFDGGGDADIVWQNANGQVSIWEMDGTTRRGGGPVSNNPGPAWKAVGTGDFYGAGDSDILFQNTSTGQVSIWEMDGNTRIGGGAVTNSLGPDWKAIGTGDFNGDGLSDILFQNTTTGEISISEMNGNSVIGGGTVSINPGSAWQAIGTGDFTDDGHSDILFQNTSTGQLSIWEMDGTTRIGGGAVSTNPGTSWHAVGTGDFTGDGFSDDILLQNTTSGQVSIWEMNGNQRTGGGAVSPNLGSSWHAIT